MPTDRQLKLYVESNVTPILKEYLPTTKDAEKNLEKYISKKQIPNSDSLVEDFVEYDLNKYKLILNKMKDMLNLSSKYERDWQKEILEIILLLYPKYIYSFEGTLVKYFNKFLYKERKKVLRYYVS